MSHEQTTETQKKPETTAKKGGKGKFILVLILTLLLGGVTWGGFHFYSQAVNYVITNNARITARLIYITSPVPGVLERFTPYRGRGIEKDEVLGWVENGPAMRSPVAGVVLHTSAVQNQAVSPQEQLAVIADVSDIHIQANIEETHLARVQLGQPVAITIDTFGNRQFTGYVSEIGRITQAELVGNPLFFTTAGTFTRVTHLVPVKINITDDINLSSLIGINARVRITAGNMDIEAPAPRRAESAIRVRGIVESVNRRKVYGTLEHLMERVYVEAGDRVEEGQTLGVLDIENLVNHFNIQIVNAEAALRIADVSVANAEHNYEILRNLHAGSAIPRNDLRQTEFALQSARASRQSARELLSATRTALARQVEDSVIRAPISGTVTAVIARKGEPGMGLMFIVEDTENLRVKAAVREYDLGIIEEGMEVTITSDALASSYKGIITRVHPAAIVDASGDILSDSVVEFEVEAAVTSINTGLRIGMNARLNIR